MTDTILLAIDGPRATITLNNPAKHNRLDTAGLGKLREAIEQADADPHVRVTVLTGAGEKSFCSGYDLGSIPSGKAARPSSETHKDSFETVMDRLEAMRMPTLCALNGGVYGGATDMALACDFRLGVKGMKFFMPAARARALPSARSCCRRISPTRTCCASAISIGWSTGWSSRPRSMRPPPSSPAWHRSRWPT
ncbi:MAG: enoyl-CoA hydratase/isomerase family protein [Alphaproteobacteria bacterium]|nr:MAG: enoyl-CoA hydratase/isomerase family protein [Alphaproteobacteria bacterium]